MVKGDVEKGLSDKLGSKYGEILSYSWTSVGNYNFVVPTYYEFDKILLVMYGGDERSKFENILSSASNFQYRVDQADPNIVLTVGGNCQAISLYLYEQFKYNGYKTGLGLDMGIEHMYTWVVVDEVKYAVDLVNETVKVM